MTHSKIEQIHRKKGKVSDKWTSCLTLHDELFETYCANQAATRQEIVSTYWD
jgi:hypothetical protein